MKLKMVMMSTVAMNLMFTLGCGKGKEANEKQVVTVLMTLPGFELQKDAYPLDRCLPVQVQARDSAGNIVGLRNPVEVKIAADGERVEFFNDQKCQQKTDRVTIPAKQLQPSFVQAAMRASKAGEVTVKLYFDGGNGAEEKSLNIKFEKQ